MRHHTNTSTKTWSKQFQAQLLSVVAAVDDGGDARRAPDGVSLAVYPIVEDLRDKNTVNIEVVGASQAKHHAIQDLFCPVFLKLFLHQLSFYKSAIEPIESPYE